MQPNQPIEPQKVSNEPQKPQDIVQNANTQQKAEPQPDIKSAENQENWKKFREQREAERKSREDSERRAREKEAEAQALRAALEAIANKPTAHSRQDTDLEESEEQRIDRRVEAKIREREQKYEQERIERERQEMPNRLQSNFSDFNKVCSSENLDYLEYHYPEVAQPFKHLPDSYEKWSGIYKAVKRFVPNPDSARDAKKIDQNMQKPGSISHPGTFQGSAAMPAPKLDEARKAANWARMQASLKSVSDK